MYIIFIATCIIYRLCTYILCTCARVTSDLPRARNEFVRNDPELAPRHGLRAASPKRFAICLERCRPRGIFVCDLCKQQKNKTTIANKIATNSSRCSPDHRFFFARELDVRINFASMRNERKVTLDNTVESHSIELLSTLVGVFFAFFFAFFFNVRRA